MCWCVLVASMQHVHVHLYLLCVLLGRQPLKLTMLNLCVYYIMYCTVYKLSICLSVLVLPGSQPLKLTVCLYRACYMFL